MRPIAAAAAAYARSDAVAVVDWKVVLLLTRRPP